MSEIGLELLEGLRQVLDEEEEKDVMLRFSKNLRALAEELEATSALTSSYAAITASLGKITDSAAEMLHASVGSCG